MKKALLTVLLATTLSLAQFVSGGGYNDNEHRIPPGTYTPTKNYHSISIHPFSLLFFGLIDILPTYIAATYEAPLSPGSALIIKPELTFGEVKVSFDDDAIAYDNFGLHVGAAYRLYFNGDVNFGSYVQPLISVGYDRLTLDVKVDDEQVKGVGSGVTTKIMGYFGRKRQWKKLTTSADVGLGYRFGSVSASAESSMGAKESADGADAGFTFDINYTIGINL